MRTFIIFALSLFCMVSIFAFELKKGVKKEETFFDKLASRNTNSDRLTYDMETAQRENAGMEKVIQLMNILGQVDSFFTRKAKNLFRSLNAIYEHDDPDAK